MKRVAIIGAGRAGLVSAKYALENSLEPVVFEKTSKLGGLWSRNNGTAIWEGMYSDISKYTMMFHDHPWPEDSPIFCTSKSVHEYFESYATRFKLQDHIRFDRKVETVKKIDEKWQVKVTNLRDNSIEIEEFDFLITASGLHSKPRIPDVDNSSEFEGILMHSSKFRLNDPLLKNKKVIVVGCSSSGTEIAASLVGHAQTVTSIFPRTYLVLPRLVKFQASSESDFSILPVDIFANRRAISHEKSNQTDEEKKLGLMIFSSLFPYQTNVENSHPDLYVDLTRTDQEILISCSDYYIQHASQGKIKPIKSKIKKFQANSAILENGMIEECDCVIFCTGYDLDLSYLDDDILKILKYDTKKYKFPIILYKYTFHPQINNFAMVGQIDGLFYTGVELQANWVLRVFTQKMRLPTKEKMIEDIEIEEDKRIKDNRSQFPHGKHTNLIDNIAEASEMLPNFEQIKKTDENLYKILWNSAINPNHFFMNDPSSIKIMNKIYEITNKVYDFKKDNDLSDICKTASKFSENYKIPKGLFTD